MTFTQFSFDSRIEAGIKSCGYSAPTPIQNQTIPFVLEGRDVMGLAQTGTGKTAAFALPILQRLLNKKSDKKGPSVLVLAPTRELALQIRESFAELGSRTGINSCSIIGGVGMNPQIKAFHRSKVVIACPGRLLGHIRNGDISLKGIDTLVLDEADRMLDMGFMPDIKRIIAQLPAKRQNLLFSATMPKDIQVFAKRILVDHEVVKVDPKAPVTSIKHVFHKTQKSRKAHILNDILKRDEHQNMLVFTRTKHLAKRLAQKLSNSGYNSISLQGNMSQAQRQKALNGFRDGRFNVMVATDIAARGIDCDNITHVINYDMPDTVETYTHRIGRTGRAGRSGSAVSFITPDDADQVRAIERNLNLTIERIVDPEADNRHARKDTRSTLPRKQNRPSNGGGRRKSRPRRGAAA